MPKRGQWGSSYDGTGVCGERCSEDDAEAGDDADEEAERDGK